MWIVDFFRFIKEWWFLIVLVGGGVVSFYKGINSINSNLVDILYQLKTFNEKIMLSEKDREKIHQELLDHDKRMDGHDRALDRHDEQLKTLFKERGK